MLRVQLAAIVDKARDVLDIPCIRVMVIVIVGLCVFIKSRDVLDIPCIRVMVIIIVGLCVFIIVCAYD